MYLHKKHCISSFTARRDLFRSDVC